MYPRAGVNEMSKTVPWEESDYAVDIRFLFKNVWLWSCDTDVDGEEESVWSYAVSKAVSNVSGERSASI